MPRYEIYKTNISTGSQKRIGAANAHSPSAALNKHFESGYSGKRSGRYLVIPAKTARQYTIIK